MVTSKGALASAPASTFTQAASTQGSTFIKTKTMASIRSPSLRPREIAAAAAGQEIMEIVEIVIVREES